MNMGFDDLVQGLIDLNKKDISEYNEIVDECERLNTENEELKTKVKESSEVLMVQHEALVISESNKEKFIKQNKIVSDLTGMVNMNKSTIATLRTQLAEAKSKAKEAETNFKNQKNANAVKQKTIDRLKKMKGVNDKSNNIKMGELPVIYRNGDHTLMVFPVLSRLNVDGVTGDHVTLLHSDSSGIFTSIVLSSDGNAIYAGLIKDEKNVNERTVNLIKKNTISPPDFVMEYAETWLYRVNVKQKCIPTQRDLKEYVVKDGE